MKRVLIIVVSLLIINHFKIPAFAAGQACCSSGFTYVEASNLCANYNRHSGGNKPTSCSSEETCFTSGILDTSGICLAAGESPTTTCCSAGSKYDPTNKRCFVGKTVHQRNCSESQDCYNNYCIDTPNNTDTGTTSINIRNVCDSVQESLRSGCPNCCKECMDAGDAWTAFGCIKVTSEGVGVFFTTMLNFGIGIAGGIAFLLILLGGFQMMTAAGNPEQLNAGKELIGSAITGLLLIIFSVFILRVIGVDVLQLPDFFQVNNGVNMGTK